jgi:hypothetical protein
MILLKIHVSAAVERAIHHAEFKTIKTPIAGDETKIPVSFTVDISRFF